MIFVTLSAAGSVTGKKHPTSCVEQPLNAPRKLTSSFPTPNSACQNGWNLPRRRVWPKSKVAPTSSQLVLPVVEPESSSATSRVLPSVRAHGPFPAAWALKACTPRSQRLLRLKPTRKLQLNPLRLVGCCVMERSRPSMKPGTRYEPHPVSTETLWGHVIFCSWPKAAILAKRNAAHIVILNFIRPLDDQGVVSNEPVFDTAIEIESPRRRLELARFHRGQLRKSG